MQQIRGAVLAGAAPPEEFAIPYPPESYRAALMRQDEVDMFEGTATRDKDLRKSSHVEDVALPELGPGEALIAVMASAINCNTVCTSIFEPVSTFGFSERYSRLSELTKREEVRPEWL